MLGSGFQKAVLFDCVIGLSGHAESIHTHLFYFRSCNHLPLTHLQAVQKLWGKANRLFFQDFVFAF